MSVSDKYDVLAYSKQEWKGETFTARAVRSGYQHLQAVTGCPFMRIIRGDNYCAIRSVAFLMLSNGGRILPSLGNDDRWEQHISTLVDRLVSKYKCDWLFDWSFAGRLPSTPDNRLEVMRKCLGYFIEQVKIARGIADDEDRQRHFLMLFNSGTAAEIRLFEAVKLMMLDTAVRLHHLNIKGEEVPVFAWLLFARDTSDDPRSLMMNHLNRVGDSGGLEQVEMCLLGQALETTIRVCRPRNVEQEDFITHYPDHMIEQWAAVNVIAEDDRHYNIAVM